MSNGFLLFIKPQSDMMIDKNDTNLYDDEVYVEICLTYMYFY